MAGVDHVTTRLQDREFRRLAEFIQGYCGIRMPPNKRTMVEGRLRRRLRALDIPDFAAYCSYIFQHNGLEDELTHLIDAITTNKTEFFRENGHFTYLVDHTLPALAKDGIGVNRPLAVWSAGCSTGCEPYTLAMVLSDVRREQPRFNFSILATDICTDVLKTAAKGIYSEEIIAPVPMDMRKRYLLRSRDRKDQLVRVAGEIRSLVRFQHLNFLDEDYDIGGLQNIVFCRNVLIYFDRPTRQIVLDGLCSKLTRGGYLFLGHSENVSDLTLPVRQVAPTVYVRT